MARVSLWGVHTGLWPDSPLPVLLEWPIPPSPLEARQHLHGHVSRLQEGTAGLKVTAMGTGSLPIAHISGWAGISAAIVRTF